MLESLSKDKWRRVGTHKRSGIVAPLFSVYSKNSLGIGDFSDLKLLIDLAHQTGNSIIQLLPMNEVGPLFCPYDSLSSFALEPMYIASNTRPKDIQKKFPAGKPRVDYGIKQAKIALFKDTYLKTKDSSAVELKEFEQHNSYWLRDFAIFKVLKDHNQGKAWYEWQYEFANRDKIALEHFKKEHAEEIDFQIWLQWIAFNQFCEVKRYAESKKVLLKGDLPILVSRDSADVWAHPEFFKLEFAAGAPPDMYCAKGQRWGMPTYNWQQIAADNYTYLKEKLRYAQNFYDILRIDHVVGLFRIWSIPFNEPQGNHGLHGSFDPADEGRWEEHGRSILSVILHNTHMLVCAEDLGVIPWACTKTIRELGIPGNDVQRWVKDWSNRHNFLKPEEYRHTSVSMLSTHDTTNWPAWWENEAGTFDEQLFVRRCNERGIDYNRVKDILFCPKRSRHGRLRWNEEIDSVDKLVSVLGKPREQLNDFVEFYLNTYKEKEKLWQHFGLKGKMREKSDAEITRAALKFILGSRSIFSIQTLIDWLFLAGMFKGDAYQYRINTPGTVSNDNWSLTLPVSLDELLKNRVCRDIKEIIKASGRA